MKKIILATLLFLFVCVSMVYAEVNIGANIEVDTLYRTESNGSDASGPKMEGRAELVAEGRTENADGLYLAGVATVEVTIDGDLEATDVFGEIGKPSWALRLGHFESEGVYSTGEDLTIAEVPNAVGEYKMEDAFGRTPNGFSLILKPRETTMADLRVTLDDGTDALLGDVRYYGFRPVGVFTTGTFNIKAGAEYMITEPRDDDAIGEKSVTGYGINPEVCFGNFIIGASAATKTDKGKNPTTGLDFDEVDTTSMVGYVVLNDFGGGMLGFGVGYIEEEVENVTVDTDQTYMYASYVYPLPIEGASIGFGASFASASDIGHATGVDGDASSCIVRLAYEF